MESIAKKLNITDQEGWYKVTVETLRMHKAGGLLASKYNNSPSKLLATVFPEYPLSNITSNCMILNIYNWDISKFTSVPTRYWNVVSNQRAFMDDLAKKLDIKEVGGWLHVNTLDIQENGGSRLLMKYNGSLGTILGTLYPEYKEMCRTVAVQAMHTLQLGKLEDLCNVNRTYPWYQVHTYSQSEFQNADLLRHHGYSITRRK